ncbi:MAG: HD domain-containing protein [Thermoleophilia bacterium]|nr:HD domain-containing protein [Thermoleophilia bacterium]
MTSPFDGDAARWAARAPHVPDAWFRRRSHLHGPVHTQRVHIHTQRLLREIGWHEDDARLALSAALWHDIGRIDDGVEPIHGARGAARADQLGLTADLSASEAMDVRFAICRHSLPDSGAAELAHRLAVDPDEVRRLTDPERALRVLWLLKDADALDRIRLGFGECADPRQLRHAAAVALVPFAAELFTVLY